MEGRRAGSRAPARDGPWTAGYAGEEGTKAGGMMKLAGVLGERTSILVCPGDAGPDEGLVLIKTSMGR